MSDPFEELADCGFVIDNMGRAIGSDGAPYWHARVSSHPDADHYTYKSVVGDSAVDAIKSALYWWRVDRFI